MAFQGLILGLVTPVVRRVLVALGIGMVTFTGYSALIDAVRGHIATQLGGLSGNALQIVTLYGLPESVAIILGGFTTAASISALKQFKIL